MNYFITIVKITLLSLSLLLVACQSNPSKQGVAHLNSNQLKEYQLAMQVAEAAEKSGNPEAEEAALKEARQQAPDNPMPVVKLVQLYNLTGQYQSAASLVQQTLPQYQNQPQIQAELQRQQSLSFWHLNQQNLSLSSLISAYPNAAHQNVVLNDMGILLDQLGQHRMAQNCYRQGLKMAPGNDILMNNYALSLICTANIDQGLQLLNSPELIGSSNSAVISNREQAINLLKKADLIHQSPEQIAETFKRQFGFDRPHPQMTQENFEKFVQICGSV